MKRVVLFLVTNLAVLLLLSITMRIFGIDYYLTAKGLNLNALLVIAALFGFGGAFFSLAISKWVAKRSTGAQVIEQPRNATEQWLVETIRRQAQQAGIAMPEVAIYDSPDINAFATGPSRNNSLVAVSSGLLYAMSRDEAEAVLGHEVSHVANGDMVTLTLIQGVVNTFVIFLARVIGFMVDSFLRRNDGESSGPGIGYWVSTIVAEIVLGVLASMIVAWFSRQREYRADAGGARLAGTGKMVAALQRLQQAHAPATLPNEMAAFGIHNGGIAKLFSSHPPLEQRIAALRERALQ
jgi:heat shock protein HtpX